VHTEEYQNLLKNIQIFSYHVKHYFKPQRIEQYVTNILNTFYDAHVALDKTVHSITRQPNYLVRTDGQSTWLSESGQTSTIR